MEKYIADAIIWDGHMRSWLRIRDLNLIEFQGEKRYTPAARGGRALYLLKEVYPYEDWMEEYIGTDKNLKSDERLKKS